MKRLFFYGFAFIALFIGACKSDSKETTTETAQDTTMVAESAPEISVDSAALAAEEEEAQKNSAAKAAGAEKATDTKKTSGSSKSSGGKTTSGGTTTASSTGAAAKPAEEEEDKGYVEFPSKRATYPGGQTALNKYLADNMKYPPQARENGIEGTVYASILVDELGTIVDVSFPKPLGYGLEEEVLRVIKGMPKLIPAEDHSKPVKTKYILPVKFNLK